MFKGLKSLFAVIIGLIVIASSAHAQTGGGGGGGGGGGPVSSRDNGTFANASFDNFDGCLQHSLYISGTSSESTGKVLLYFSMSEWNYCEQVGGPYSYGYSEEGTVFVDDKLSGATVGGLVTVTLCDSSGCHGSASVKISATWIGDGKTGRTTATYRDRRPDDTKYTHTYLTDYRYGLAAAVVTIDEVEVNTGSVAWASIGTIKQSFGIK